MYTHVFYDSLGFLRQIQVEPGKKIFRIPLGRGWGGMVDAQLWSDAGGRLGN